MTEKHSIERLDESAIHAFGDLVKRIRESLGDPRKCDAEQNVGHKEYIDADQRFHITKCLRNACAVQRLESMHDRLKDTIFILQFHNREFELSNPKAQQEFLRLLTGRFFTFLVRNTAFGLLNFVAHFFDVEGKNDELDEIELLNEVAFADEEVARRLNALFSAPAFNEIKRFYLETERDYAGLSMLSSTSSTPDRFSLNITPPRGYPIAEILQETTAYLNALYDTLHYLAEHIEEHYQKSRGFDSPHDCSIIPDPASQRYIRPTDAFLHQRRSEMVRVYNLTGKSPQELKADEFLVHKNFTFEQVKERFFRSSDSVTTNVNLAQGHPAKVERTIHKKQEGELLWTHTLFIEKDAEGLKRFEDVNHYADCVCLLLSFLGGSGVYTKESGLSYSHKAQAPNHLYDYEFPGWMNVAWKTLIEMTDKDFGMTLSILHKYRDAMQPMFTNNRLVRLWEIIDVLADHYCDSPKKDIPDGYTEETLKQKLTDELDSLESQINIKLRKGFTPILIDKSVAQRIRDLLAKFAIADFLEVTEKELNSTIKKANRFRSKLTHSAKPGAKDEFEKNLMQFYLFIADLTFVLIAKILGIESGDTLKFKKVDLQHFCKNPNYYLEKHEKLLQNSKNFEQVLRIMSGEEPFPEGKKKISF